MTELTVTRLLDASVERVWQALTDTHALVTWFWPTSFQTAVSASVAVGGTFRIASETASLAVSGRYLIVDRPHRLVFTWQWDGEAAESEVSIDLAAHGDKTELVVRHQKLANDTERDNHADGWNDCLDRLPAWLGLRIPPSHEAAPPEA